MTRGEKQCDPVQLCPGSAKLRAWGLQGDRFPAASQDVATPVWRMSEPWHRSGSDGDGASRQSTSSGGRGPGGRACWQRAPARGIIFALKKRQRNSIAKDIVPVTVTEMTLGLARLQSSCEVAPAVLQLMPIVTAELPCKITPL